MKDKYMYTPLGIHVSPFCIAREYYHIVGAVSFLIICHDSPSILAGKNVLNCCLIDTPLL